MTRAIMWAVIEDVKATVQAMAVARDEAGSRHRSESLST